MTATSIPNDGSALELAMMQDNDRFKIVTQLLDGCQHIYSKGKLQEDKLNPVLDTFLRLRKDDPIFLGHLTSWAIRKSDNKDFKLLAVFANSLSDADGTPFSPGSEYRKPNIRMVSQAAVQTESFDAKLLERLIELTKRRVSLDGKPAVPHMSKSLANAIKKYLRYRETNLKAIEGVVKSGLKNRYVGLYKAVHLAPSEEAAKTLRWKQKSWKKEGKVVELKDAFGFKNLSDEEIAEKIVAEKIPALGAIGALPRKISPVLACAILQVCTPDQAVILREVFETHNLLRHKEVMDLFESKVALAKSALDRVDRLNSAVSETTRMVLENARSEKRKAEVAKGGGGDKIYIHADFSGSMNPVKDFLLEYGATIAECIPNPAENLRIGLFQSTGFTLNNPKTFTKSAFQSILYSHQPSGMTNIYANWKFARTFEATVDIFITDAEHTTGGSFEQYLQASPSRPRLALVYLIEPVPGQSHRYEQLYNSYIRIPFEKAGIEVVKLNPKALTESALVAQTLKEAMMGKINLVEEILNTKLLTLPKWWNSISVTPEKPTKTAKAPAKKSRKKATV